MSFDANSIGNMLATGFAGITVMMALKAVLLVIICLVSMKIILGIVRRGLAPASMDAMLKKIILVTLKVILLVLTVIVVLDYLDIPVTSLVAVLSVVGLALSLAVQNFLSNVAGGLQLVASKPFQIGDFVEIAGCSGKVTEIGLFYTKLNSSDNKLLQLPNSAIVSESIINHSGEEKRRVEVKVTASYDAPVHEVKGILERLVVEHDLTCSDPAPMVHVNAYLDSSIEYVVRVWCANDDYWTVYFDLMDSIKPAFDAAGIEMTYPHVNVHMAEK